MKVQIKTAENGYIITSIDGKDGNGNIMTRDQVVQNHDIHDDD